MLEHFKGDEAFVKKIQDYGAQADLQQRMILTRFYNPHERDIVKKVIGHNLQVVSYGGFEGAENKRMIIAPDYYEISDDDFDICVLRVDYQDHFGILKHKDVLGALMSLGIKREVIGDICENPLSFAICGDQKDYVMMHLDQIRRSGVKLKETSEVITITHEYRVKELVASSLRLDKLIGLLFGLSRTKASDAIRAGSVKVNYKPVEDVNHLCHNNDVLSFAKHGRVKLKVTDKITKSGNKVIEGYFYK